MGHTYVGFAEVLRFCGGDILAAANCVPGEQMRVKVMDNRARDRMFGIGFLALGVLLLVLALTNRQIMIGTGLCLALGVLFLRRSGQR